MSQNKLLNYQSVVFFCILVSIIGSVGLGRPAVSSASAASDDRLIGQADWTGSLVSLGQQPVDPEPAIEPTDEPTSGPVQNAVSQAYLANPAAVYCADLGYEYQVVKSEKGEHGLCVFPDGSKCEQWDFMAGKCGAGHSFCAKKGYKTETRNDGKNPFSPEYAVCVNGKGQMVGSVTDLADLANKSGKEMSPDRNAGLNYTPASPADLSAAGSVDSATSLEALPASFDWRNVDGQNWMTPVKNQASCGSCWAFAAVGSLEAQYNIDRSNADLDLNLAEQYLVSTCTNAGDCGGGWSDMALEYIRDDGIPDEACMPYKASNNTCSERCGDWSSRLTFANSVSHFYPTQATLKQAVVNQGPVVVYLLADGMFDSEGVYRCAYDRPDGYYGINHAVVITGYDDAGGYWKVRNSWGNTWNGNGYFNVGYDECNIDSTFATYAVPTVPVPPDPVVPAAPSNLIASAFSKFQISLSWADNSSNETGFRLERSADGISDWSEVATTQANVTFIDDVGPLQCGTSYYYRVRAQNAVGSSDFSAVAEGSTRPCALPPPNDNLANAQTISTMPFFHSQDISAATTELGDPVTSCGNQQHSNSVWYQYTPGDGLLTISTWASDYDTVVAVWTGSPGNLDEVACNDDSFSIMGSFVETEVSADTLYYIEVMSANLTGDGMLYLDVGFSSAPSNDDFDTPTVVSRIPFYDSIDTRLGTLAVDDPPLTQCNRTAGQATMWYLYQAQADGELLIDTMYSSYDTMLAVWTGTRGNLVPVACHDHETSPFANLSIPVTKGTVYYIEAAEYDGIVNLASQENGQGAGVDAPSLGGQLSFHLMLLPTPLEEGLHQETNPHIAYTGLWTTYSGDGPSGGSLLYSDDWEASATFRYTGSKVTIYRTLDPTRGVMEVCVDGSCQMVDNYSALTQWAQPVTFIGEESYSVHAVQIRGMYGGRLDLDAIEVMGPVPTPNLIAPVDKSVVTDSTPTLDWENVPGATLYQVQIDEDAGFSSPLLVNTTTTASIYTHPTVLADGKYYWRVRARNAALRWGAYSNIWSMNIDVYPPAPPVLASPANSAVVANSTPSFDWGDVDDAVQYQIQIDDSSAFSNPVLVDTPVNTSSYTPELVFGDKTYYWRVRAQDAAGLWGAYSPVWRVTIDTVPPLAPSLSKPADHARVTSRPTLSVLAVTGAKRYHFQVARNYNFTPLVLDVTNTTPAYTLTAAQALPYGRYFWRVEALDAAGNASSWGFVRSFTVTIQTGPADTGTITTVKPTFTWVAVAGALEYHLQLDRNGTFDDPVVDRYQAGGTSYLGPTLDYGWYYWRMQFRTASDWSDWMPVWTFKVTPPPSPAPVLTSPANAAVLNDNTPTLSWKAVAEDAMYDIEVDNQSTFASPELWYTSRAGQQSFTVFSELPDGVYYWRVRTVNYLYVKGPWGAPRRFTVDTLLPAAPILSSPANNASVAGTPTYVWRASATAVRYQLRYGSTDCSDDNASYDSPELSTTSHKPPTQDPGAYVWCARARDAAGNWSAWSTPRSLTIGLPKPGTPVLSAPANGLVSKDKAPVLSWKAAAYGITYEVQVDRQSTFALPLDRTSTTTAGVLTYTVDPELADGDDAAIVYYWRVRAVNVDGIPGAWSAAWRFTVDTLPPAAPILSSPANNASVAGTPTYVWRASATAVRYQLRYGSTDCSDDNASYDSPELATTSHKPPTQEPGDYVWCARARDAAGNWSAWSTPRSLTIEPAAPAAPTLASPANGSLSREAILTLTWNAVPYGVTYQFQVDDNSTFSSPELGDTTSTTSMVLLPLSDGVHYWRVRSLNALGTASAWSTAWRFTIRLLPTKPVLLSPDDGFLYSLGTKPLLVWEAAENAVYYNVEIASDVDFSQVWWSGSSEGVTAVGPSTESAGVYYWRVQAFNMFDEPSEWSEPRTFVVSQPPAAPLVLSVSGALTDAASTPTFSWESVDNAATYELELDDSDAFDSLELDATAVETSLTPAEPLANGTYFWRVRALTADGTPGEWSAVQTVTIDVPPAAPGLLAPVDASADATGTPIFSWESTVDAVKYQIQVDGSADFSSPELDNSADGTSFTPAEPLANGMYSWRVRAITASGTPGEWSQAHSIVIAS